MKSITGYVLTLVRCPIIWCSKIQTENALSTTKAEYIDLSQAMRERILMLSLLLEITTEINLDGDKAALIKSNVFNKNNRALATAKAIKLTPFTKRIGVK